VVKVHAREAMDENFGNDPAAEDKTKEQPIAPKTTSRFSKKYTNAYMLVYIRESEIDKVLCPVTESDLSEAARARFILEQQTEVALGISNPTPAPLTLLYYFLTLGAKAEGEGRAAPLHAS